MRGARIALVCGVVLCLVFAAIWLSRRQRPALAASMPASAAVYPQPAARPTLSAPSSAPRGVAVATAQSPGAADCGLPQWHGNPSPPAADAEPDASAPETAAIDDARRETAARLLQRSEPMRQAAGLLLASQQEMFTAIISCQKAEGCAGAAPPPPPGLDQLAALARVSDSPSVYGLALQACRAPVTSSFCASLSTERWAQLAPQSAWPWLRLSDEARRRADVSGVEYAMNRAARASDWRAPSAGYAETVIDELPADLPAPVRFMMIADALNTEYSLLGAVQGLTTYCPVDPEPGRRQVCLQLAEHMLDRTDNVIGIRIAIRLGERAGVPADRLAALREEVDSLLEAGSMPILIDPRDPAAVACARLTRATVELERRARIGELAALRELHSGAAPPSASR